MNLPADRKIIIIDCRDMEPPDPFVTVMKAVDQLSNDEAILMRHRHPPRLLFPKLIELGLNHEMHSMPDGSIELLIWRAANENR